MLLLLAGALLRLSFLDSVPPGLTHDEANNVYDGAAVLRGVCPMFFSVAQGKEPLYPYSVAGMMALVGRTPFAMRLTTAFWGLLLLASTFALIHRLFGPPEALLTLAGLALSFWGFTTSRMGLRAITLPLSFSLSLYFLHRSIAPRREATEQAERALPGPALRDAALSGFFLGVSQYTYLAARIAPAVLVLFGLYLALRERGWVPVVRVVLALGVAALVAAPLFIHLHLNPGLAIRVGMLDQPLRALLAGNPGPLWDRVRSAGRMFFLFGDTFVPYNLPGRPLFDPLTGALFVAGLGLALWRWRRPAYALALIWFGVGVFPALATGIEAVNLRAILAQPVVFLFPALPIAALMRRLRAPRWRAVVAGLAGLLLVAMTVEGAYAYFVTWANDRDVRVHYHVDLLEMADYLDAHPEQGPVAVSALFPGQFHDPRVVIAALGPDTASQLRWFDARGGLILPSVPGRLIRPAITPPDGALEPYYAAYAAPIDVVTLRPDDFDSAFTVYRWDGPGVLADVLPEMGQRPVWWSAAEAFPADDPTEAYQPLTRPVALGDGAALAGYDLDGQVAGPGDTVVLVTLWQVTGQASGEVVLFTHLLDPSGAVVAQDDKLDVPSWNWHEGEYFLQVHRLSLPTDLAPGVYPLQVGAYLRRDPSARLPVQVEPGVTQDRILLMPVEVTGP